MSVDMPGYGTLTEPPEYSKKEPICKNCGEEKENCTCEEFIEDTAGEDCIGCPCLRCKGRGTGNCPPEE